MTGYSTREISEVLGLSVSTILSWTRAGLLSPVRGARGAYLFSFQDLALLRRARDLVGAEVSPSKVKRALVALRESIPPGRPLSAVDLTALGDAVLVRDAGAVWDPTTGQIQLGLPERRGPAGRRAEDRQGGADVHPLDRRGARREAEHGGAAETSGPLPSADAWYDAALDLEGSAPERAKEAYARALALDPGHPEAHLNLGRLLHEEGAVAEAEEHYRTALEADPGSARAFYNLGVALEDQGRRPGAVEAYEAALRLDGDLAVAHFNLARLLEALGRQADALAHLAAYKRILDRGGLGA